jgi:organic radical activating enzyme
MDLIEVRSKQPKHIITINWAISNVCNYKCWYCFPGSNTGDFNNLPLDLAIKNFDHLFQQYQIKLHKTRFDLVLTGGEPTLWRNLRPFIEYFRKKYKDQITITIVSNFSRTLRWWDENCDLFDTIVGSYHINEGNLTKYIEIADHISGKGREVLAFMLMDSRRWNECIDIMETMKKSKNHWIIYPKRLECLDPKDEYSIEQLDYFSKNQFARPPKKHFSNIVGGHMISTAVTTNKEEHDAIGTFYITRDINRFEGWQCSIGLEFISIRWNGEIHGNCGTPLFGKDFKFNIRDEKFVEKFDVDLAAKPICKIKICECTPETHVTKKKLF